MRLINCTTLRLENDDDWPPGKIPEYAILSHTWAQDGSEVAYQEYLAGRSAAPAQNWTKIDRAIELTLKQGLNHVWIDTCCIDKSSSAELTEAINSMFKWYADASVCFAQMEGFKRGAQLNNSPVFTGVTVTQLGGCRWFSRGWTLQELIAPPKVRFYDDEWVYFGARSQLSALLSEITGIDRQVLDDPSDPRQVRRPQDVLRKVTVSKKMSWAASRKTKRVEDMAYSLLGLFGVNMPMLYGEGERAFIRLQEEIMRETDDLTIFAWCRPDDGTEPENGASGILARSPEDFTRSDFGSSPHSGFNPEFVMTNKGVRIKTQLRRHLTQKGLFMSLNCHGPASNRNENLGILLQHRGMNIYSRADPHHLFVEGAGALLPEQVVYLQKYPQSVESENETVSSTGRGSIQFDFDGEKILYDRLGTSHSEYWYEPEKKFSAGELPRFSAYVRLRTKNFDGEGKVDFIIACGYRNLSQPWVTIAKDGKTIHAAATAENWDKVESHAEGGQTAVCEFYYAYQEKGLYSSHRGLGITATISAVPGGSEGEFVVRVTGKCFRHSSCIVQ